MDIDEWNFPDVLKEATLNVSAREIRLYADITDDRNPIHLDAEFTRTTQMGGIIAHGTMSLNLVWQSLSASIGKEQMRRVDLNAKFVRPVRLQDVVVAGGARRNDTSTYDVWVKNQNGEDVITGFAMVRAVSTEK